MKKILFENQKNVVGTQLKLQRIKKGLSQSQLAAKVQTLGVSLDQQMISKIEKNDRIVTVTSWRAFVMCWYHAGRNAAGFL